MELELWMWVAIAVLVLVIIIIVVVATTRGKSEKRNRERAAELRSRAAEDDQLIATRQDRAAQLEVEEEAARQEAIAEYERAEALRAQAAESDKRAAQATDEAKILHDEAAQSREAYQNAVEEHDETLREADRRDPDIYTDRHGNRVEDPDEVIVVIPNEERLDADDDYSGDEFGEPDAEYIDPVEHDRLAQLDEAALTEDQQDTHSDTPAEPERITQGSTAHDSADREEVVVDDMVIPAEFHPDETVPAEPVPAEHPSAPEDESDQRPEDEALALDPYGNPVTVDSEEARGGATAVQPDDIPRDEHGRRLDPYGNPVPEDTEHETSTSDPVLTDDADDDIPRDEQGRRLDPYGNPVPDNLQ